jgi:hypothetical protein
VEHRHETSPSQFSIFGNRRRRDASPVARCIGVRLSNASGAHHRWFSARRSVRHCGAALSPMAVAAASPKFIVENRPGASSNIAAEEVVQAPADGYTLLLVTATNAINATLYDHLSFNFIRDVAPVSGVVRVPNVMVINPSVPADTLPAFITYAKANPGKINMASGGVGTPSPCCGRVIQGDGRRQFGSRAIPRRCAGPR